MLRIIRLLDERLAHLEADQRGAQGAGSDEDVQEAVPLKARRA